MAAAARQGVQETAQKMPTDKIYQADPLLIRRPLLEVDGVCRAGFDVAVIKDWIGLSAASGGENIEACLGGDQCSGHDDGHAHEPGAALEA